MTFVLYILVFWLGIIVGILTKILWNYKFTDFAGILLITKSKNKTLYSLELYEDLEILDSKKKILFKVNHSPKKNLDRN